jgi:hypothetical protein
MFTWICPQCGKEVPPSSSECPACAERRQQAAQAPPPPQYQPAPPPPQQQPPYYPPQPQPQPQYQPPTPQQQAPYYPPQPQPQYQPAPPQQPVYTIDNGRKKGIPAWLAALLTVALIGGGLVVVYKLLSNKNGAPAAVTEATKAQQPAVASGHPFAKYIEVVGVRILESADKKPLVRFAVINHSPAELSGLELRVTLAAAEATSPLAVVDAKVGSLPAYGVKDMESPITTTLRIYELPDWQFVRTTVEITSPK